MKTLTLILTKLVLVAGLCLGSGMLKAQWPNGWGNPFKYFCGEPCGIDMRRNFQFYIHPTGNDITITSINVNQIYGVEYFTNTLVASGLISACYPIPLPAGVSTTSTCLAAYPFGGAPTPPIPNLTTCVFPRTIPDADQDRFFLMEVLFALDCIEPEDPNWVSPVGGQRLPVAIYYVDWEIHGEELLPNGDSQSFVWNETTILDCQSEVDSSYRTGHNIQNGNSIQVYPSQVENKLTCSLDIEHTSKGDLIIKDVTGKTVKIVWNGTNLTKGVLKESVDVSMLSDGIYFMEFRTANSLSTQKFIKY